MLAIKRQSSWTSFHLSSYYDAVTTKNAKQVHVSLPASSNDDGKRLTWHNDSTVTYPAQYHLLTHQISADEMAMRPFVNDYCDDNLTTIAAMHAVLSQAHDDNGESKKQVFMHLIKSSQDASLLPLIRDLLVELIDKLNDNKAFVGIDLSGMDFSGLVVTDLDLNHAIIKGAIFLNADFRRTDLSHADMTGSDFSHADFRFANLRETNLTDVCCYGCKLVGANMFRTILPPLMTSAKLSSQRAYTELRARIDKSLWGIE